MSKGSISLWLGILFLFIAGSVVAKAAAAETITYTYDDLNRLTQVSSGTRYVVDYTYDEVGNRTSMTIIFDIVPPDTLLDSANRSAGVTKITDICVKHRRHPDSGIRFL